MGEKTLHQTTYINVQTSHLVTRENPFFWLEMLCLVYPNNIVCIRRYKTTVYTNPIQIFVFAFFEMKNVYINPTQYINFWFSTKQNEKKTDNKTGA